MRQNYILFSFLMFALGSLDAQVIYNAYAKVTNISGTTMTVTNLTEPTSYSFAAGEQFLLMQMQDDVIGTNTTASLSTFGDISSIQSAGRWELKTVSTITRSGSTATITFSGSLNNTYNFGSNASLQIVTLKKLSNAAFTTSANITGTAWNGSIGGVVAIEVGTNLTLQHSISANVLGFRGGTVSTNFSGAQCTAASTTVYAANDNQRGYKGEGIQFNTNANYANARGRLASGGGGGNHHNGGGGGGGHWTTGGQGGNGYNNCTTNPGGGIGGQSLASFIPSSRIFMGGGGGGGQINNSTGSSGANGGGIVIVKADQLTTGTTCTSGISITANGGTAASGNNDGQGGGGAGGTVILQINSFSLSATCPLTVTASGGNGGTSSNGAEHAGGGGGAQGVVVFSAAMPTVNILVATNNGTPGCNNNSSPCNNSAGAPTGTNNSGVLTTIGGVLPIELLSFAAKKQGSHVDITWSTSSETSNDFFTLEKSVDAIHFTELKKVKSKAKNGNSKIKMEYSEKDLNPYYGTSYYRLKQTDLTGEVKTFHTISVKNADITKVQVAVFPNPNTGDFTIDFSQVNKNTDLDIILQDITGKQIFSKHFNSGFAENTLSLGSNEQISPGVYVCNIISEGVKLPLKIIVQ